MIKFHPDGSLLEDFVSGSLTSGMGLVIATHVDMCQRCQQLIAELEHEVAESMLVNQETIGISDCEVMLDTIFNSPGPAPEAIISAPGLLNGVITHQGKLFNLPRTLARQEERIEPWFLMIDNVWAAPLQLGTDETTTLTFLDKNVASPEHAHEGIEATVVLDGSFTDDYYTYEPGDFVLLEGPDQKHAPKTTESHCLTLAVLDKPLIFTSAVHRLVNPFSNLFFN